MPPPAPRRARRARRRRRVRAGLVYASFSPRLIRRPARSWRREIGDVLAPLHGAYGVRCGLVTGVGALAQLGHREEDALGDAQAAHALDVRPSGERELRAPADRR